MAWRAFKRVNMVGTTGERVVEPWFGEDSEVEERVRGEDIALEGVGRRSRFFGR